MKVSVRSALYKSVKDYPVIWDEKKHKTRVDWVKSHPG